MPPYGASKMGERWRLVADNGNQGRGRDLVDKLDYPFKDF